jgi:hypothetical protein
MSVFLDQPFVVNSPNSTVTADEVPNCKLYSFLLCLLRTLTGRLSRPFFFFIFRSTLCTPTTMSPSKETL